MREINNPQLFHEYISDKPFTEYFQKNIAVYAKLVEFEENEYVFVQDEIPEFLYLMVHGRCRVQTLLPNGKGIILHTMKAPCLIGEMELIREVPTFTVQTLESCRMLSIPFKQCKEYLLEDAFFLRKLCFELIGKERMNAAALIHAFGYPLENRLAKFILENRQEDKFIVRKVDVAESLGVSYRHVGKVMKDFVDKKYLMKEKFIYTIINENALMDLAKELEL